MKRLLVVSLLILGCMAKQAPIFCYDSRSTSQIGEVDGLMMTWMVQQSKEMMEEELQDVSIEDAASLLPQLLNQTFVNVFQQALDDYENVTTAATAGATIQGFLNTSRGEDMLKEMLLQDASSYGQTISTIFSNFDGECLTQGTAVFFDTVDYMLSDILSLMSIQQAEIIVAQAGVTIARIENLQQNWVNILTPLSEIQLDGLLEFLPTNGGDLVSSVLGNLLEDFLKFPAGSTKSITNLVNKVQDTFKLDTVGIVAAAQEVAALVLADLS
eukprot:TRINITY_DN21275_c0_g1_i12.p1 TRINITY_DN21275_c0_g1~~TRINITY_DN21275_c0_g1_i12.p1  ORF type:complete len:271 (+),score=57.73 TRINITY_DN21275_c0_g1_i12:85-897(+)